MRAVTIDSDLATLFTFTPRKPPITPIQEVEIGCFHNQTVREECLIHGQRGCPHVQSLPASGAPHRRV